MLGYLIPDVLQRLLVQFVTPLPIALQIFAFAVLSVVFLLVISRIVRRACLTLDVEMAMRARLRGTALPVHVSAMGWFGVGQWWFFVCLCVLFVFATVIFALGRAGTFDTSAMPFDLFRTIHICMAPNSGNGDSMARCGLL